MRTRYTITATVLLAVILGGAGVAGADKPEAPLPGVRVELVISVKEYDPSRPSKGTVRCSVVNTSDAPVEVSVGFDGRINQLKARGKGQPDDVHLYPASTKKQKELKPQPAKVKPDQTQVVFELPLDEILFQGVKPESSDDLAWEWAHQRRAKNPFDTPIHAWAPQKDFVEDAAFWAVVTINDKSLVSTKVVLKVGAK